MIPGQEKNKKEIEVTVHGVMPDPASDSHILLLRPAKDAGDGVLSIWIGTPEANAIRAGIDMAKEFDSVERFPWPLPQVAPSPLRPLTHDLTGNILSYLKLPLKKVLIHRVDQGTFFANLEFSHRGSEMLIDARPSDAVALALRMKAPVYIREDVYLSQQTLLSQTPAPKLPQKPV
ncbi:MAG TPA: bifunctional nuclease family protein [Nitrospiria bacterium]|nr:bifunctional nuclease family protein [Nitrospiria bacterium]